MSSSSWHFLGLELGTSASTSIITVRSPETRTTLTGTLQPNPPQHYACPLHYYPAPARTTPHHTGRGQARTGWTGQGEQHNATQRTSALALVPAFTNASLSGKSCRLITLFFDFSHADSSEHLHDPTEPTLRESGLELVGRARYLRDSLLSSWEGTKSSSKNSRSHSAFRVPVRILDLDWIRLNWMHPF